MDGNAEECDHKGGRRPFRQGLGASSTSRAGVKRKCGRRVARVRGPAAQVGAIRPHLDPVGAPRVGGEGLLAEPVPIGFPGLAEPPDLQSAHPTASVVSEER